MRFKNKELYLLRIFLFVYYMAWTFIFFFIPVYLREQKNFSIGMIGVLAGLFGFFGAFSQVYIGYLSDKFRKRKPFMVLSAIMLMLGYGYLFPKLGSYLSFLIIYPIFGIFMNTITTLSNVLILDYSSTSSVGRSFASTRVWAPIGFLVMMLATGFYPKLTDPKYMFPIISAIFLLCFLILLLVKEPEFKVETKTLTFSDVKRLVLIKEIREFLLFMFFYSFALAGTSGNVNLLIKYLGGSNSDISWALVVCSAPEIPMSYLWGNMADKVGKKSLLLLAGIAMPIRSALYFFVRNSFNVILIQFFTHVFTFVITINVAPIYMNDLVSPEERATGQGILNLSIALSQTLSSFVAGNVADVVGLKGMYLFLGLIGTIGGIWGLRIFKNTGSH